MGTWSSTAPTLPAGSEWSAYTAETSYTANHYKHTLSIRVARLQGRQVCIGVKYVQANGSYGDWSSPGTCTVTPRVGSTNENTTTLSASKTTRYRYYITEADPGVTLRITTALQYNSIYRTITAPPLLPSGPNAYVYSSGWNEAKEVSTYSSGWNAGNDISVHDGSWKEST